jgi:hypothetical protein
MKQCPQCKHIYEDKLKFCLSDGVPLASLSDSPEETIVIRPSHVLSQIPQSAHNGVNPLFSYLSVGLFALLIGGAIVYWMKADLNALPTAKNENLTNNAGKVNDEQNTKLTGYPESNAHNDSNTSISLAKTEQTPRSLDTSASLLEVKAALNDWVQASVNRNFENQIKYYADRIETYYRKNNVSVSFVRHDKQSSFERYSVVDISLSNLKIDVNSTTGQVVTTFDKTFNAKGNDTYVNGAVQSQLRWVKNNGLWKIISEKDLQIYYINKQ